MLILWGINALVIKWPVHVAENPSQWSGNLPTLGAQLKHQQLKRNHSAVNGNGSTEIYEGNGKVRNVLVE